MGALEEVAVNDEYFIKRKLYPNVDYYSGIMLRALGIPTSMFTVMFAMSRCVGWMAQWNEMHNESQMRISRPRQIYAGEKLRTFCIKDEHKKDDDDGFGSDGDSPVQARVHRTSSYQDDGICKRSSFKTAQPE